MSELRAEDVLNELRRWRHQYGHLHEFDPVWHAVDELTVDRTNQIRPRGEIKN